MAEPIFIEVMVDVRFEDREGRYVARAEEFPELQGLGQTPKDAVVELYGAIRMWFAMLKKTGGIPPT